MTKGRCTWCDEVVDGARMGTHLKKHLDMTITPNTGRGAAAAKGAAAKGKGKGRGKKAGTSGDTQEEAEAAPPPPPPNRDAFVLKIVDSDDHDYWMFVRAHVRAKLSDLDEMLREVWAGCCPDHESYFRIRGAIYEDEDEDEDEDDADDLLAIVRRGGQYGYRPRPLSSYLRNVVRHKDKIWYFFDSSNTTELEITVYATASSSKMDAPIGMLARNEDPEFECSSCKAENASKVCGKCIGERNPLYCNGCLHEHPCGDGHALPVENTPRLGVCPYEGLSDKERRAKREKDARASMSPISLDDMDVRSLVAQFLGVGRR